MDSNINTEAPGQLSLRHAALISGIGILLMTLFYFLSASLVFQKIIVPEDTARTVANISNNETLFRVGICGYLLVIICDLVVAWALYVFLKPVAKQLSLLAAWCRLIYTIIYALALVQYFKALQLLSGATYLKDVETTQLHTQAMLAINTFNDTWAIGFVFFGIHLAILGFLALNAPYIPKFLGGLLILAGISYLIDHLAAFLFPELQIATSVVLGWGELIFMIWLLFSGVNQH